MDGSAGSNAGKLREARPDKLSREIFHLLPIPSRRGRASYLDKVSRLLV